MRDKHLGRAKFSNSNFRIKFATGTVIFIIMATSSTSSAIGNASTHKVESKTIVRSSLQSKYAYFKKNNSKVITAILTTKCPGPSFSYKWREGAEIWVSQTKKHVQGGISMYPTIAYRKATSINKEFVLTPAGESELWWRKKWGCPVNGKFNTYGTKVGMTTQQLINAGY